MSAPETSRNRAIREARADLRVALYYEDGDAGEAALAALAALGVDEAGDDVAARGRRSPAAMMSDAATMLPMGATRALLCDLALRLSLGEPAADVGALLPSARPTWTRGERQAFALARLAVST